MKLSLFPLFNSLIFSILVFAFSHGSAQTCESIFSSISRGQNSRLATVLFDPSWLAKAETEYLKNLKELGVTAQLSLEQSDLGAGQMLSSYSQRHPEIQSGLLNIGFSSATDRFVFPQSFGDLVTKIADAQDSIGAQFKIATYNSKKWFRLDQPMPRFSRIEAASDMPFLLYAEALANGYTLLWPGRESLRILHDLSHVTEYLEHPEVFPALQKFFQRYISENWKAKPYYKMRAEFFNEVSYILKPSMYGEVDALLVSPNGTNDSIATRSLGLKNELKSDLSTTLDKIQKLVAAFDALFDRHGGGARDAFNIDLALNLATVESYVNALKVDPMIATHAKQFPKGFTYPTMESLEGIKVQIQYVAKQLEDMKSRDEVLEKFLAHRVAQFEMALLKQKELELTQVDIIEDSMLPLGADSKTSRYLRSFMSPKSILGGLYFE